MATMTPSRVDEELAAEERSAWLEYLADTFGLPAAQYESVEPHAWARLQARRDRIESRRKTLKGERS